MSDSLAEPMTAEQMAHLRAWVATGGIRHDVPAAVILATIDARDAEIARLGERIAALTTVADDKHGWVQVPAGMTAKIAAERDEARGQLAAALDVIGRLARRKSLHGGTGFTYFECRLCVATSEQPDRSTSWTDVRHTAACFLASPANASIVKRVALLEAEHAAAVAMHRAQDAALLCDTSGLNRDADLAERRHSEAVAAVEGEG